MSAFPGAEKEKKTFSRSRSCRPSPCPLSAGLLVRVIDCKNIIYVDDCFMCNKTPSKSIVWCSPTRDAGLWPLKRDCDCGPLSVTATTLSDALTVITIYITCTSTARGSVRLHTRTVMYFMHLILSVVSQQYQIGMWYCNGISLSSKWTMYIVCFMHVVIFS